MIVAVYKERGPTSREVVNKIKKLVGEKKVGHGGTLDPLAEGVLIVGVGRESTKKLHSPQFEEKEYIAKIKLGWSSETDDEEGEKQEVEVTNPPGIDEVEKAVSSFEGIIKQVPPKFSAVKIKGKEAYKYSRKGVEVTIKERPAEIKKITIISYTYPFLNIKTVTGKGVYIRSLARDIGEKLSTKGYLHSLIRTRVGKFTINDCKEYSFFEN